MDIFKEFVIIFGDCSLYIYNIEIYSRATLISVRLRTGMSFENNQFLSLFDKSDD